MTLALDTVLDGGAPGSGGKGGAGGSTGTGGGTAIDAGAKPVCGGEAGWQCLPGDFCDIVDHCGTTGADMSGHCVSTGPTVICDGIFKPVCGCDGKTYPNDCERGAAGVQKFSDGPCATSRDASADTERNAGLSWQAATVSSLTGPAIVVTGRGWYAASTNTRWQDLTSLLLDGIPSYSLSNAQLDDLFARVAAVDFSALPHVAADPGTCTATLMVSACTSCPRKTLTYASAAQLAPDMEPVWAWFDQVLGSPTAATNPRTYCRN